MLRRTVNVGKLRIHCHDVCNINHPTCISVNCVEILLSIIRSNVHKTVVSYKTVQSFCSDAVVQNVNVISSPICKVFCFKKHHHVSPIKCFMLETSPFAVIPSTKLPSSSILSPPSSSLSSLSSSSSISTSPSSSLSSSSSSPLSLNPPFSSSSWVSLYFFLTSEVHASPSYLNSSVFFLTTCFLLFTGFRCNILLKNIHIDLLLLALGFLKNFSTFNKRYSKFIMCYNFNYRLVLDLYILFQSFRAVLITQKLGSNFKYQLHCIMACVIIITFNRFLNLKWLINMSSFIYSKLAHLAIKTCSKSSWGLQINKHNLVKFFPGLFFIKFLVSIFKMIINFIFRNIN